MTDIDNKPITEDQFKEEAISGFIKLGISKEISKNIVEDYIKQYHQEIENRLRNPDIKKK